jgi:hypothetical protein
MAICLSYLPEETFGSYMAESLLASVGIPCNVIAAFHHDHLFVPFANREHALEILKHLQQGSE